MLNSTWVCKASESAKTNFSNLERKAKARYNNQNNVIKLLSTVAEGYEDTERINESLSSRFK